MLFFKFHKNSFLKQNSNSSPLLKSTLSVYECNMHIYKQNLQDLHNDNAMQILQSLKVCKYIQVIFVLRSIKKKLTHLVYLFHKLLFLLHIITGFEEGVEHAPHTDLRFHVPTYTKWMRKTYWSVCSTETECCAFFSLLQWNELSSPPMGLSGRCTFCVVCYKVESR